MLAAAVDAGKRLFVEEYLQVMLHRYLPHQRHELQIVIDRNVGILELRCTLELIGSHLIVTGLYRNTEPVGGILKVLHKLLDPLRNCAPIVVLQLLVLGRSVPHKRAPCLHEVRTGIEKSLIYKEIFLLPPEGRINLGNVLVEKLADRDGG